MDGIFEKAVSQRLNNQKRDGFWTVLMKEMGIQKQSPHTCVLNAQNRGDKESLRLERSSLI